MDAGECGSPHEPRLARAAFIRQLTDISSGAPFVHEVSAKRCDNCGHGIAHLASPARRQLARILGADRRGTLYFCYVRWI